MLVQTTISGAPAAMYDDDLAHISGDISCEGCMQTLNGHLTDYA